MCRALLSIILLLPLTLRAQDSSLKQPMFKDLQVTSSITKSYGDSTCIFHVAAIDEDITPEISKRYYWYNHGEIKNTQGSYTGKLLHGAYEKFDRDGTLLEKGNFDNGVRDGEWFNWYTNGNIMRHYNWNKGLRTGHFQYYDAQGNTTTVGEFRRGILNGTVHYFENGTEVRQEKYRNGKLVKAKEKKKRFWEFRKKSQKTNTLPTITPDPDPTVPPAAEEKKPKERKKKKQQTEDPNVNR